MKILSPNQIKIIDEKTIKSQHIKSVDLIDRVGLLCCEWIVSQFSTIEEVYVFSGPGNNGGDGIAIAKYLNKIGIPTKIIHDTSSKGSNDRSYHCNTINEKIQTCDLKNTNTLKPGKNHLIIDCLFGTGLNRSIDTPFKETIEWINLQTCKTLSIDLPSGLDIKKHLDHNIIAVKADFTLCLQIPKKEYFIAPLNNYIGQLININIGLDMTAIKTIHSSEIAIDLEEVKQIYKKRKLNSHKGNHGRALVVAGSEGMMGAATLCTKACVNSGAGLTTSYVPSNGLNNIQQMVPEAMAIVSETISIDKYLLQTNYNAIGIGPGLGLNKDTETFVKKTLELTEAQLVIDADAINAVSKMETLKIKSKSIIITPHIKELERLAKRKFKNRTEAENFSKKLAKDKNWTVILKGSHTAICSPNGMVFYNTTGNPGMAKGGSGDVLTGILTGLLAQNYTPTNAAILGVYIHGKAADIAIQKTSFESLSPIDVINCIGKAFRHLEN